MAFEQDAFSQDVRLGILDAAKRTKSKIIIDDKLPKELNDMAATLAKVKGKNYKFKIIYYDDESNSGRAAQLAERLIKQDGVQYMLGPYSSGLTKAMAPVTEKYKIPMVEANGASRSLYTKGYKYLYAVLAPANLY